ncbi:hypothetical protein BJY59DRAFT_718317 [Rhodotorula toruloides]
MPAYSPMRSVGATGKQGSAIKLKDQGVEVVRENLADEQSLGEALVGVRSAFLDTHSSTSERPTSRRRRRRPATANLVFLVFSSVTDATPMIGISHIDSEVRIEEGLRESGIEWKVVAPVLFMDNFPKRNGLMRSLALGFFRAVFGSRQLQLVSTGDIGYLAATMLSDPSTYFNRRLNLASDALSTSDIQAIYSRIFNQPVWSTWMPGFSERAEKSASITCSSRLRLG